MSAESLTRQQILELQRKVFKHLVEFTKAVCVHTQRMEDTLQAGRYEPKYILHSLVTLMEIHIQHPPHWRYTGSCMLSPSPRALCSNGWGRGGILCLESLSGPLTPQLSSEGPVCTEWL